MSNFHVLHFHVCFSMWLSYTNQIICVNGQLDELTERQSLSQDYNVSLKP